MSDFELPLFCLVDDQPVLAVATKEGGMDILAFNLDTLEFERDMSFLTAITLGDADHVSEEEFLRIVEQLREPDDAVTAYDVIGDVHGCGDTLVALLRRLGYAERSGAWRHADRQAVFVGDLIDRGGRQVETLGLVRRMVDAGSARLVMGNHEFNAIAYVTRHPSRPGEYMRSHNHDHRHQHAAFLDQVGEGSTLHIEVIEWFRSLPLWLELGGLRVVHACWHAPSMQAVAGRAAVMDDAFVIAANTRGTPEHEAIEVLLKGPEVPVSPAYLDKEGKRRDRARIRWWDHRATTLRAIAEIPSNSVTPDGDPYPVLSDEPSDVAEAYRYHDDTPVLFGHYWTTIKRLVVDERAACVDLSAVRGGHLAAYRWDGEPTLDVTKIVHVSSTVV